MKTSLGVDRACWQAFPDEILGVVDGQHRSIVWGLRRVQERRFVRRLPPVLAGKIDGGDLPGDGGAVTLPMAFAYVEAYAAALVPARQGVSHLRILLRNRLQGRGSHGPRGAGSVPSPPQYEDEGGKLYPSHQDSQDTHTAQHSQESLESQGDPVNNPFRPSAGATPPEIIGRVGLLDEFAYGLRLGSGAPGLLTIFTGARGIGKTVMLGAAQDLAREQGWAVISETATRGFMGRIGESMLRLSEELGNGRPGRRITGVAAAGFSVTTQLPPEKQVDWRITGETLLRLLDKNQTGLVITVDEIHAADRSEIAQLAANVQHFIQDGLPIGLVFAGLPAAVSDLLNEGVATFLRRADKIDLHAAAVRDVETSFTRTFADAGFALSSKLAQHAAAATGGYPFLIQLVGYFLWKESEQANAALDLEAVQRAIDAAHRRNARTVIEAALSTASRKDLDFLHAMSIDEGPTASGEIGHRLGAKPNTVANYRSRLIAVGLIEPAEYGHVTFAIPGLREHLRNIAPRG